MGENENKSEVSLNEKLIANLSPGFEPDYETFLKVGESGIHILSKKNEDKHLVNLFDNEFVLTTEEMMRASMVFHKFLSDSYEEDFNSIISQKIEEFSPFVEKTDSDILFFTTEQKQPEEQIETFENEFHEPAEVTAEKAEQKKEEIASKVDDMIFGNMPAVEEVPEELPAEIVAEKVLETSEFEQIPEELPKDNIYDINHEGNDVPVHKMTDEEAIAVANEVSQEEEKVDITTAKKEMLQEMRDYQILHQREFEDLSKLQLAAELEVSVKDLQKINSCLIDNKNIVDIIDGIDDEDQIMAESSRWSENAMEIVQIHRNYFKLADNEVKKVLVRGVFEAFNAFDAENKIDLMKDYSLFLANKNEDEEKPKDNLEDASGSMNEASTEGGYAVPKMPHLDQDDEIHGSVKPGMHGSHGILPGMTEEEEQEMKDHEAFVSRMEDLENMLTGDYEIQPEETPTFEKIQQIAEAHGELAAKEYVASLSQEQREQLARERMAKVKEEKEKRLHAGEEVAAGTEQPKTE